MIRLVKESDAQAIADIYNHYVTNTIITFEEKKVGMAEMKDRIRKISSAYPYIVFEEEEHIKGYAYMSTWNTKIKKSAINSTNGSM